MSLVFTLYTHLQIVKQIMHSIFSESESDAVLLADVNNSETIGSPIKCN